MSDNGGKDSELGPFWERKISNWVNRIDLDKDGVISLKEFEWLSDRYLNVSKCSEEEANELRTGLRQIWKVYFEEPSKNQPITAKVYSEALRKFGKPQLVMVVTNFFPRFFDIVDTDADGKIGLEEYRQFLDIFGMDPGDAEVAFGHLDTDKDGILSREEFLAASLECFCGDDETSPYQYFAGTIQG